MILEGVNPKSSGRKVLVDGMLGSLARKLRIMGIDTLYRRDTKDSEIVRMALETKRTLLSSDKELVERAEESGVLAVLIRGEDDGERLREAVRVLRSKGIKLVLGESFCAVCNGNLEKLDRRGMRERKVPTQHSLVMKKHRSFWLCTNCGKLYWRGKHWERLRRMRASLGNEL